MRHCCRAKRVGAEYFDAVRIAIKQTENRNVQLTRHTSKEAAWLSEQKFEVNRANRVATSG